MLSDFSQDEPVSLFLGCRFVNSFNFIYSTVLGNKNSKYDIEIGRGINPECFHNVR